MRKFLLILGLLLMSMVAVADDLPVIGGVKALRTPVESIVREAGRGDQADLGALGGYSAEADKAWKLAMSEPLDWDRYGIAADRQEEAWRRLRLLGMLIGYMDEAAKRGDRALMLRAAGMLPDAYQQLAAMLGLR